MKLDELVKDWGGFERLVADLHETGDVVVERGTVLTGLSGAPRQIDVVLRQRGALYEHLVLIECKLWKRRVRREQVDALATSVRDLRAAKGVIFSTKGFQEGAITQAKADGIELIAIRELEKREWGLPGRVVDLFLQIVQLGVPKASFPKAQFHPRFAGAIPSAVGLRYDGEAPTPLRGERGEPTEQTLEQVVEDGCNGIASEALKQLGTFNGGEDGDFYAVCPGTLNFDRPIIFATMTGVIVAPTIKLELPLKISQSRVTYDRATDLTFALAVESKVTGLVRSAARPAGSKRTLIRDIASKPSGAAEEQDALQNGSVARVVLKGFHDVSEIEKMTPVAISELVRRVVSP